MIDNPKLQEACRNYQKTLRSKYEPFASWVNNADKSGGRNAYVIDTRTCEEVISTYPDQVHGEVETANIIFRHCTMTPQERENWRVAKVAAQLLHL